MLHSMSTTITPSNLFSSGGSWERHGTLFFCLQKKKGRHSVGLHESVLKIFLVHGKLLTFESQKIVLRHE